MTSPSEGPRDPSPGPRPASYLRLVPTHPKPPFIPSWVFHRSYMAPTSSSGLQFTASAPDENDAVPEYEQLSREQGYAVASSKWATWVPALIGAGLWYLLALVLAAIFNSGRLFLAMAVLGLGMLFWAWYVYYNRDMHPKAVLTHEGIDTVHGWYRFTTRHTPDSVLGDVSAPIASPRILFEALNIGHLVIQEGEGGEATTRTIRWVRNPEAVARLIRQVAGQQEASQRETSRIGIDQLEVAQRQLTAQHLGNLLATRTIFGPDVVGPITLLAAYEQVVALDRSAGGLYGGIIMHLRRLIAGAPDQPTNDGFGSNGSGNPPVGPTDPDGTSNPHPEA